jgi:hypothetical protein
VNAVWPWMAAVGVVAAGLIVGRVLVRRIERRQRLKLAAIWAAVNDDYAIAYLEELHRLPAHTPEHERQ